MLCFKSKKFNLSTEYPYKGEQLSQIWMPTCDASISEKVVPLYEILGSQMKYCKRPTGTGTQAKVTHIDSELA